MDADDGTGGTGDMPPDNGGSGGAGIGGGVSGSGGNAGDGGSGGGGSGGSGGNDVPDAAPPPRDTAPARDTAPPADLAGQATPDTAPPPVDTAPTSTLAMGLVGRWKFDEGSGTSAADSSASGNDGSLTGGASWLKAGFTGAMFTNPGAIRFDGTDGVMDLATFKSLPALDAKKSISVWMNFAAPGGTAANHPAVGFGDSKTTMTGRLKLGINKNGQLAVWKGDGTIMVGVTSTGITGAWHHVAYTFDGNMHHLYVDGQEKAAGTTAADSGAVAQAHVGSFGTEHYAGDLDDLRVYNRTLTAAEVAALKSGQE